MSDNSLQLSTRGNWSPGNQHRSSSPDHDQHHGQTSSVPWPLYHRSDEQAHYSPWRLFEERVRTGPFGITRFPLQPYSPIRILVLDSRPEERVNPRLRQFIRTNTPPRIRGEWRLGLTQEPEEPGLSNEEFKKAMKKLKKQSYIPPNQKRRVQRGGLFSNRRSSKSGSKAAEEDKDEEGKVCAVCLEAFVLNEQVLVTPCNHMFHYDCLVPWVKSHGQCPVCRFALCERRETAPLVMTNDDMEEVDLALDLISLIRAMEEALNWVSLH